MSASLLGLPLELALRELSDRGVAPVAVERLRAPGRGAGAAGGGAACGEGDGDWRVVRVREGESVALDVCCFKAICDGGANAV